MIITCPQCRTKFRLEDGRIPETGARARCSRCRKIFQVQPNGTGEPPAAFETSAERAGEGQPRSRRIPRFGLALGALIVILAAGGYGVFFFRENVTPLLKPGVILGGVKQYLGFPAEAEGSVFLEKVRGYYLENAKLNRIFIIEGQAVNRWKESRSFIKVKGSLLDSRGMRLQERMVYCGNVLAEKDLKELDRDSIEKSLSSQFGVSFSNVNVPPQKSVPFMIVFTDLPAGALEEKPSREASGNSKESLSWISDFTAEVAGSQKGSK